MNWGYAAIMLSAPVAALAARRLAPAPLPLAPREKAGLLFGAFCGSMILAKLPYVLFSSSGPNSISAWMENGKTITLGLVGGYIGVELAKYRLGIRIKTGDSFAVPAAVAIAVGRLGCFYAGCCYGTCTNLPWAVRFADGQPRHPTQLYEVAFHSAAAVTLYQLQKRGMFRGQLIKLYFIAYFVYRFLTEFIRPEPKVLLGLTAYQWSAVIFIPVFILLWIIDERRFTQLRQGKAIQ